MSGLMKIRHIAVAVFCCACVLAVGYGCSSNGSRDVIGQDTTVHFDIQYGDRIEPEVGYDLGDAECRGDGDCGPDKPKCLTSQGICVECLIQADCKGRGFCLDGYVCGSAMCQPDEKTCVKNKAKVCNADGTVLEETECGKDKVCYEGACLGCAPNVGDCPSPGVARMCKEDGSGWEETNCTGDLMCANGSCLTCIPGLTICDGAAKISKCAMDGSGFLPDKDCWELKAGDICHNGQCINLCDFTSKFYTNKGCEYWAIDMEQFIDSEPPYYGEDAPFAVVVSNTYEAYDALVTVYHGATKVKQVTAPAGLATIISLDPLNLNESSVTNNTYRVESNLPIVAYQFNPLENVDVFSNDASLLLPTNILGRNYRIMSMPNGGANASGQNLTSNFAIVAVDEGETTIKVTPTADIAAGTGLTGVAKDVMGTWKLQKGQVANVKALPLPRLDLTGTLLESDKRIAVFSGHVCSTAPVSTCKGGKCNFDPTVSCSTSPDCPVVMACDHIEEQIQPIEAWGKEYVVPKTKARGLSKDLIRVMASVDNTRIRIVPPGPGIPVLNAGEFAEFEIDKSVVLSSDNPFFAAIILEGEDAPGSYHDQCANAAMTDFCENDPGMCSCVYSSESCETNADCSPEDANVGDPSLITAVPIEQLRDYYVFLVPTKYKDSYISITATKGATVTVDNTVMAASEFTNIAGTNYMTAVKHMNPGSHTLSSTEMVGVYVYGWDRYVSYGYPGGMMLIKLATDD